MSSDVMHSRTSAGEAGNLGMWLGLIAATWIAVTLSLATKGIFDVPPDSPALPTLIAVVIPVAAFAGSMMLSPRMRVLAMGLDPVLLTEFQAWRILGGLFLALYAFGHLPGFFAWPAGLGDVAVGAAASFMALSLRSQPGFLASTRFRMFN